MHAIVARSNFEVKRVKTDGLGPLLDVQMSKCARLWREAISKSKVLRTDGLGALLDVQMSFRK